MSKFLPLLRADSIGTLMPSNGVWNLSFSGADGYTYIVQTSTNLTDWQNLGTNQPVQGVFSAPGAPASSPNQFYRTALLPQ
jgi:hypothetical protein